MLGRFIRFIKKWWFVICIVAVILVAVFFNVICDYISNELNDAVANFIKNLF